MHQDLQINSHTTSNTKEQETKMLMVLTTKTLTVLTIKTLMVKTINTGLIIMEDSLDMELKAAMVMQINSTNYSKCPWIKVTHSKLL